MKNIPPVIGGPSRYSNPQKNKSRPKGYMGPTRYLSATRGTYNIIYVHCHTRLAHSSQSWPSDSSVSVPRLLLHCSFQSLLDRRDRGTVSFYLYLRSTVAHSSNRKLDFALWTLFKGNKSKGQKLVCDWKSVYLYEFIKLSGTINLMTDISHPVTTAKGSELTICIFFYSSSKTLFTPLGADLLPPKARDTTLHMLRVETLSIFVL